MNCNTNAAFSAERAFFRAASFPLKEINRTGKRVDVSQGSTELFKWNHYAPPFQLIRLGHFGRTIMATQIVMDHTGDTRHCFNPDDVQAVADAERRFIELTKAGFTAAVRTASGEVSKVQSFDPHAEETLFFARLVGG